MELFDKVDALRPTNLADALIRTKAKLSSNTKSRTTAVKQPAGIFMVQRTGMFDPISMDQIKIQDLSINLLESNPMPCQSTKVVGCFNAMNAKNGATSTTSAPSAQHH